MKMSLSQKAIAKEFGVVLMQELVQVFSNNIFAAQYVTDDTNNVHVSGRVGLQ